RAVWRIDGFGPRAASWHAGPVPPSYSSRGNSGARPRSADIVSGTAGFEQVGVGTRDQLSETLGGLRFGEAERDRVLRVGRRQSCRDLVEARPGFCGAEVRHRTDELVTAVAQNHVVGA